jgi:hypothetical protein
MKPFAQFLRTRVLTAVALSAGGLISTVALADAVNALYNSVTDVPLTANGYIAKGNTANFTLNCALVTGTELMVANHSPLQGWRKLRKQGKNEGATLRYSLSCNSLQQFQPIAEIVADCPGAAWRIPLVTHPRLWHMRSAGLNRFKPEAHGAA